MYTKYAELREKAGIRDADVARATGIYPSILTDWKKGKSTPRIDNLVKIANFFGVTLDEFVRKE